MNKKNVYGFTLIELLGAIIILSIIMLIAIPNVTSVLEKSKKSAYLSDAKKMISQVEYELGTGKIEKPVPTEIVRVRLSYIGTSDVSKDSDGNSYDLDNSYVIVVRKNGYLEYYVNLVANVNGKNKGIRLCHKNELNSDNKLSLIKNDFKNPTDEEIVTITQITGSIKNY